METTLFEPMLACPVHMMAISMVLTAAGMAAQFVGQKRQATAQKAYQEQLAQIQQKAAMEKNKTTRVQQLQADEATAKKNRVAALQAENLAAEGRLSAAAGGVTGLSIAHLQQSREAAEGRFYHALSVESSWRDKAYESQVETTLMTAEQQMRATRGIVQEPNALAMGLQAAGTMFGQAATASDMKADAEFRKKSLAQGKVPTGPKN